MATLDASQSTVTFSADVGYVSVVSPTPTVFTWLTQATSQNPADTISAAGSGFTYNAGLPTGGTVTSVTNFGEDALADWVLTGISVPLTQLVTPGNYQLSLIRFWETVLGGDDTIIAPIDQGGVLFGDFTQVAVVPGSFQEVTRTGGDDSFIANSGSGRVPIALRSSSPALVGDALSVDGAEEEINGSPVAFSATVNGGDDTFTLTGGSHFLTVGDVRDVGPLGVVNGGNDTVNSSVEGFSALGSDPAAYTGDVVGNSGFVHGGADTILGSNFPFIAERIIGDAVENFAGGTLVGGADRLFGRAGQDFIAGDVFDLNGGVVTGGADVIRGGEDSDIIAGDAFRSRPGVGTAVFTLNGGNDNIRGEAGNDWLIGDMWDLTNVDPSSVLNGGNDQLFGGDGDDMLVGDFGGPLAGLTVTGGNDTLDGGAGIDLLIGGGGNDTYLNPQGDTIVEEAGGGTDTVKSDVTFSLAPIANVENLILTGSAALNGTGNSLANVIRGNAGANTLSGLGGDDSLDGGAAADTLLGSGGNDTMQGGAGADSMTGGTGNDTYFVDAGADVTAEAAGEGTDTVFSTVSHTLANNIEILRLQGAADLNGNGNTLNNKLFGNAGDNRLQGLAGNDQLDGGAGADTLVGGEGNDTLTGGGGADLFRFARTNAGNDRIVGFQPSVDSFDLSGGFFSQLTITAGGDSILTHDGGTIRVEGISNLSLSDWNALAGIETARSVSGHDLTAAWFAAGGWDFA